MPGQTDKTPGIFLLPSVLPSVPPSGLWSFVTQPLPVPQPAAILIMFCRALFTRCSCIARGLLFTKHSPTHRVNIHPLSLFLSLSLSTRFQNDTPRWLCRHPLYMLACPSPHIALAQTIQLRQTDGLHRWRPAMDSTDTRQHDPCTPASTLHPLAYFDRGLASVHPSRQPTWTFSLPPTRSP